MNKKNISIGESELEIMKVLWKAEKPLTSVEIASFVESKNWKKTTIATFLTRLAEKGAINAEKQGKLYCYSPVLSEEEYKRSQTDNLINTLFGGSVKDFAVALFKDGGLSAEEINELKDLIYEGGE